MGKLIIRGGETKKERYLCTKRNLDAKGIRKLAYRIKFWWWYVTDSI